MIICFSETAWKDYLYWQKQDKKVLKRINKLIRDIIRNPESSEGIGRPEILKGDLGGYYSRRLAREHRLVYTIKGKRLIIAQCRFHY